MKVTLNVVGGPHAGKSFSFSQHDNFIVGRSQRTHFRLAKQDKYFSRFHFMIEMNPPLCRLMDLRSTNGTDVDGIKLDGDTVKCADLKDGSLIRGGETVLRVSIDADDSIASAREMTGEQPSAAKIDTLSPEGTPVGVRAPEIREELFEPLDYEDLELLEPIDDEPEAETVPIEELLPRDYEKRIASRPQPFDGYQVVDQIGEGAMGVVFRAIREMNQTIVALKTIRPAVAASSVEVDRFLREARILEELVHPKIVRFLDMGEASGDIFFAMEYVKGVDAAEVLREQRKKAQTGLDISRAVQIVCDLLDALEYAHSLRFVHRDIKPANLLLTEIDGKQTAKLADFGLARTYQASRLSGLTMIGDIGGTAPFMPPEQITAYRDVQPPADQYAAAATLYNLLTGRYVHDFPGDVAQQLMLILDHNAIPIQKRRPELPDGLAISIHRALARDAGNRFTGVDEFREALEQFC